MNKTGKAILSLIIVISLSLPCIMGLNYKEAMTEYSPEKYIADLTSIYKEYNGDLEKLDENDELALNRLVVANYNGKLYGAVKRAWDKNNKFAVLQYDSKEEAASALKKIKKDGGLAEGDSLAKLIYDECEIEEESSEKLRLSGEKGTIHPDGSNYLGTTAFIDKINMNLDDVIVAVIDTGVMYDHSKIADRFYSHGVDLSSDAAADAYYDTTKTGEYYGHATMVSGIVADNTPDNVKILPYKAVAFGATYATASAMMSGINQAVDAGASVVSMSLSASSNKSLFSNVIDNAKSKGVCVCTSAGNTGAELNTSPANVEDNITVAALDGDTIASFSSFGETVDFTAQGYRIRSTFPASDVGGYARGTGTSFSTPYVAACFADIKSLNKKMSWDDAYNAILDFVVDIGDEGHDPYYGYGAPNLANMDYTDGESYSFSIPEGTLNITQARDYTAESQPWRRFAPNMSRVNIDESVERIGDYAFCNMNSAEFNMRDTYKNIGAYAFYACNMLSGFTCGIDVESVGYGAFKDIDGFVLSGYRNTPAEKCALHDGVTFNALGCKHDYYYEVIDPTKTEAGYTLYTCSVCGDTYRGEYIEPKPLKSGSCGANMTYTVYDTGKLTLSGEGDMYDYIYSGAPWKSYAGTITKVQLEDNINKISPFAFYGCDNIKKFAVSEDNENYYQDASNLIYKEDNSLVLAVADSVYTIPDIVESFNSSAFIFGAPQRIIGNDKFIYKDDVIYDNDNNIIMALPAYSEEKLVVDGNIKINKYAFLLCEYPNIVYCDWISAEIGDFAIGYTFNGSLVKGDVTFYTGSDTKLYTYATRKGFTVNSDDCGKCGDGIMWRYDLDSKKITLSGEGEMYTYTKKADIPWASYLSSLKEIKISDGVTYISPYSFYRASNLRTLTMPLSLKAPENDYTWQGCTLISTINLTYGNGITDDYGENSSSLVYTYTPWYISRSSLTSLSLDENVKYIGSYMFRNCSALRALSFNCVEEIANHAFVSCTNLTQVTNYCKTTVYHDYSLFSYQFGNASQGIYENKTLYAFSDSTSKDYCDSNVISFSSIGCGHSRSTSYVRDERTCFGTDIIYHCDDCGEDYIYDSVKDGDEYDFSLTAENLKGVKISGAEIYINGCLFGKTDNVGRVSKKAVGGTYDFKLAVNSCVIYESEITIPEKECVASLVFRYGNYNGDNAVNGKDYSISLRKENNDKELFDYGKINNNESKIVFE